MSKRVEVDVDGHTSSCLYCLFLSGRSYTPCLEAGLTAYCMASSLWTGSFMFACILCVSSSPIRVQYNEQLDSEDCYLIPQRISLTELHLSVSAAELSILFSCLYLSFCTMGKHISSSIFCVASTGTEAFLYVVALAYLHQMAACRCMRMKPRSHEPHSMIAAVVRCALCAGVGSGCLRRSVA